MIIVKTIDENLKKIRTKLGLAQRKYIFLLVAIVILILTVITIFIGRQTNQQPPNLASTTSPVNRITNSDSVFGTMIAFNINEAAMDTPGISDALQKGWAEFKKDNSAYQELLNNLKKLIQDRTKLVKATGFALDRGSFVYFTWNVIEPQKGQFDWEIADIYAKGAANAGVKISAVIEPFAGWDQKNTEVNANCKMLDAAYYDYKAGPPKDLTEYENFLTKTVERYKDSVAVWEIGNENDAQCGGYQDNPQGYFNLLKMTSETIKKVDSKAVVVNGGASGHFDNSSEINFWTKFSQLGGGQYIDYFNLHYNDERNSSPKLDPAAFQKDLMFWNDLMDKNGGKKSLYLTEFGIYSGLPSTGQPSQELKQNQTNSSTQPTSSLQPSNPPSGGKCGDGICDAFEKQNPERCSQDCSGSATSGNLVQPFGQSPQGQAIGQNVQLNQRQTLRNVSESAQAALYFKDSILAFANGVKVIFIDLIGPNDSIVGSSMAFNTNDQPRLFLTTLKTVQSKIGGFSKIEKITDGQYKFTVGGKTVYALWSGTLPNEISGKVKVTNIKGQEKNVDATAVKLNVDQPVLIELQK